MMSPMMSHDSSLHQIVSPKTVGTSSLTKKLGNQTASQQRITTAQFILQQANAYSLDDSLQQYTESPPSRQSSDYNQMEQLTGRMGSTDTGINTAAIIAINEALRYEERADEEACDEDRLLLLEDTQTLIKDTHDLLDS